MTTVIQNLILCQSPALTTNAGSRADCPARWNPVPVSANGVACSGAGVPVPATSTCLCWDGYVGSACSSCAAGYEASAGLCQRAPGSFAAASRPPAAGPPPALAFTAAAAAATVTNFSAAGGGQSAAEATGSSALSQRVLQMSTPPPPSSQPAQKDRHSGSRVGGVAVGCAVAAAALLIVAVVAVAVFRWRRSMGTQEKPGRRQFAVGVPPGSPPKALPHEVRR